MQSYAVKSPSKQDLLPEKVQHTATKTATSGLAMVYYGVQYLDGKTSRWISADPAVSEYIPQAPINDDAKKRNKNLPGMGGVFNYVNMHVYHYAGNNPVKLVDPNGRAAGELFESVDAAAKDWAKVYYGITDYTLLEQSSVIYEVFDKKNKSVGYSYTPAIIGEPHRNSVSKNDIPNGTVYIGYIHSHANSPGFSVGDIFAAASPKGLAFVVVPGANAGEVNILKFQKEEFDIKTIAENVRFNEMGYRDRIELPLRYQKIWNDHINAGCEFDCKDLPWPRRR